MFTEAEARFEQQRNMPKKVSARVRSVQRGGVHISTGDSPSLSATPLLMDTSGLVLKLWLPISLVPRLHSTAFYRNETMRGNETN